MISGKLTFLYYRWLQLVRELSGTPKYLSLSPVSRELLLESKSVHNNPPANVDPIRALWLPDAHWQDYVTNNVYLNQFKSVNVSFEGIIFRGIDAFPGSYVYPAFYDKFGVSYMLGIYRGCRMKKCDPRYEYLVIYDHWSAFNYFHWICDSIPRLQLFKAHFPDKKMIRVLLPATAPRYVADSLSLLGYEAEYIAAGEYASAEKVWHVDYLADSGFASEKLVEAIHSLPGKTAAPDQRKKLYVSRSRSGKRSIDNESILIELCKASGVETVYTENLSLAEQRQLFSSADLLISSHGAGLTNMLFMPGGSRIIEIGFSDIKKQPVCYWAMANTLGFPYYYIPASYTDRDTYVLTPDNIDMISQAILGRR